ncbi:MAG: CRTAC1 family protein [Rhodothermales bacterium]
MDQAKCRNIKGQPHSLELDVMARAGFIVQRLTIRLTLIFLGGLFIGSGCSKSEGPENPTPVEAILPFSLELVTSTAGLDNFNHVNGATGEKWFPETMGAGGAFLDFDNDGWLDIILVGGGTWEDNNNTPALSLYRNTQDGTFTDATQEAGLATLRAYGFGIAAADYDNDGDADLVFTSLSGTMLLNNSDGVFTDVSESAGLAETNTWNTSILFVDADLDGWLDLYLGSYVDWSKEADIFCTLDGSNKSYCTPELYDGVESLFFYNNGDGTFSDQTTARGFASSPGKTLGAALFDYNADGKPDLIVSNDTQRDLLYENNGDGTFTEKGQLSGIAFDENGKARAGMGVDTGFIDESGREAIFVGNFSKEMIAVFQHIGDGLFVDKAARSQIGRPSLLTLTFGLTLLDIDLDGDLDLFTANGHLQSEIENTQEGISYRQLPHLFLNDGSGSFTDVAAKIPETTLAPIVGRGIAYGDYDKDGDLDVLITENGGPAHLWNNDLSSDNNYLRVHLTGNESNKDALGARIEVIADGKTQIRYVRTGSSYLSQSELTATFGLGSATTVDTLSIVWPNGKKDTQLNVQAGQELRVVE